MSFFSSSAPMPKAHKKLMKEMEKMRAALRDDPTLGIGAKPINDTDLTEWEAVIEGPPDSPFAGGWFALRLSFPPRYPHQPPKVVFTTPVFHPNIYTNNSICLDILNEKWSPVFQITSVLTSIRSLLDDPNVNSPANVDAARVYRADTNEYAQRVARHMQQSGRTTQPLPAWYVELKALHAENSTEADAMQEE